MIKQIVFLTLFALASIMPAHSVLAQSKTDTKASAKTDSKTDFEFIASVNGAAITESLLNLNIRSLVSQGQKDTPELRQAVKEDLINKELIAQEATRLGLNSQIDFADQITQLRQNLLLQAYLEDLLKQEPITDAMMREEYTRQRKLMGEGSNGIQYRLSQIVVSNETDALDLTRRIQKGELFGKLAQEYSIDSGSKAQGGSLGWVMSGQVIPAVGNVLPSLTKGAVTTTPIQTSVGWVILKLDDKRNFKIPSYEEAKAQIRQAIVQQYLAQAVKNLRVNARIVQ
ncbi:peptidylprolyl isomerase [Polynucleobacter sp. AP-Mumm-500A-B3]|nr:peptidylprolyl isomerase [Polynucleobacter nymphae]